MQKPLARECRNCESTTGPAIAVYYKQRGSELVILLAGGDKGSQSQDIKIALRLAKNLPDSF